MWPTVPRIPTKLQCFLLLVFHSNHRNSLQFSFLATEQFQFLCIIFIPGNGSTGRYMGCHWKAYTINKVFAT